MKLNYDCVRDVLLYIEENIEYINTDNNLAHKSLNFGQVIKGLPKYEKNDVIYSIEKLFEARFIVLTSLYRNNSGEITKAQIADITWNGHDFLNNIREEVVWDATKIAANKVKAVSVFTLKTISAQIIKMLITNSGVINSAVEMIGKIIP